MRELQPPPADAERRRSNIILLVLALIVVGIGVWLVNALVDARKADECITQGRRNCVPIDATPR